ncbi:MAG: FAD-binding oxidoreductase [Thermococci archaeon]|nr:FAD-binding oxidoreductase [Thermococci archaeon]
MRSRADVVVIGGGIVGLSTAYHLAKLGADVVVLEKGYVGSGSTFRCASGIRAQFTDEANVKLMKYSVKRWKELSDELGYDVGFVQTGYLFLATTEDEADVFRRTVKLHRRLGLGTRIIDMDEAREIVPILNTEPFILGQWNPEDGKASPFKSTFAFLMRAREMGVEVHEYTPVTAILVENGEVMGVKAGDRTIKADAVLNATNAWAPLVNEMAGLDRELIPIKPFKHQLVKTEPIKPGLVNPLVSPPSWNDSYIIQDAEDGGVIGGAGVEHGPTYDVTPTYDFLREVVRWMTRIAPPLKYVHIIRQWAGFYAKTPDSNPVMGEIKYVNGLYIAAGFSGHGFMMAPGVSEAMADLIMKGRTKVPLDWEWYDPHRFERGELRTSAFQIG